MDENSTTRRDFTHSMANVALVVAIAWLVLLFLFEFIENAGVGRYGVVVVIAALVCACVLVWDSASKINVVLVMASIGGAIYLAELLLFLGPRVLTDNGVVSQVVASLRKTGVDAYPAAFPSLYVKADGLRNGDQSIFPLSGIANKLTVYCKETEEVVTYWSDKHGFNNPSGVYDVQLDLVLIGDSFAQGACVAPGNDLAGRLRQMGWKVLNLGYGGNGPLLELATLKEYAVRLQPRYVLWLYYEGNDFYDLLVERQSRSLLQYLQEDHTQHLMERQSDIAGALEKVLIDGAISRSFWERRWVVYVVGILRLSGWRQLINVVSMRFPAFRGGQYRINDDALFDLFEKILAHAKDRTSSWGGEMYFVYLPSSFRYQSGIDGTQLFSRGRVLSIVRRLSIPLIDFDEVIDTPQNAARVFPYLGAHYSREGYSLLADRINASLTRADR